MNRFKKYVGHKFGHLTVTGIAEKVRYRTYLFCDCDCGEKKIKIRSDSISGGTQTCGCRNGVPIQKRIQIAKEKRREYYQQNAETLKEAERKKRLSLRKRFDRGRLSSIDRGIDWELSYEEWLPLATADCFYCEGIFGATAGTRAGLDRKDNSAGYTKENVVACCQTCNRSKGPWFTMEEFKAMMGEFVRIRRGN